MPVGTPGATGSTGIPGAAPESPATAVGTVGVGTGAVANAVGTQDTTAGACTPLCDSEWNSFAKRAISAVSRGFPALGASPVNGTP